MLPEQKEGIILLRSCDCSMIAGFSAFMANFPGHAEFKIWPTSSQDDPKSQGYSLVMSYIYKQGSIPLIQKIVLIRTYNGTVIDAQWLALSVRESPINRSIGISIVDSSSCGRPRYLCSSERRVCSSLLQKLHSDQPCAFYRLGAQGDGIFKHR